MLCTNHTLEMTYLKIGFLFCTTIVMEYLIHLAFITARTLFILMAFLLVPPSFSEQKLIQRQKIMIPRQLFKSLEIILCSKVIYKHDNGGDYNFPTLGNIRGHVVIGFSGQCFFFFVKL